MSDFNKDNIVDGVLQYASGMEITNCDAIATLAVDATLRYVVDWLNSEDESLADVLESLGDL